MNTLGVVKVNVQTNLLICSSLKNFSAIKYLSYFTVQNLVSNCIDSWNKSSQTADRVSAAASKRAVSNK